MKTMIRVAIGTALILLVPLIAMQLTSEVNWTLSDFVIAAVLLLGTGGLYTLFTRKLMSKQSRIIVGAVLFLLLAMVWVDLAVGIFNIPGVSGS